MVTTAGAVGAFDYIPEDEEQFGALDRALSDSKSRLHTAHAIGGAFAGMEVVRALVSMLSGDPMIGGAQAAELRTGYVQVADARTGPQANVTIDSLVREINGSTQAISRFVQEHPNSLAGPESMVALLPVLPNGKWLNQLVNGGDRLPKQTFSQVTGVPMLTIENYVAVVNALFDTRDIEMWLVRSTGEKMSAAELAEYRKNMEIFKTNWLGKLEAFQKAGKNDVIVNWLKRFNAFTGQVIHGSREEYRRGLIHTHALANWSSITPDKQHIFLQNTVTAGGELALMTQRNLKDANKISVWVKQRAEEHLGVTQRIGLVKYIVPGDEDMVRIGFPEGAVLNGTFLSKLLQSAADDLAKDKQVLAAVYSEEWKVQALVTMRSTTEIFDRLDVLMRQFADHPDRRSDELLRAEISENLRKLESLHARVMMFWKQDPTHRYIQQESIRGREQAMRDIRSVAMTTGFLKKGS